MCIIPFLSRGGQHLSTHFFSMQIHKQPFLLEQRVNIQRFFSGIHSHSLKTAILIQHILPSFNQSAINPQDFLYCVCSGHYNSVPTSSATFWLNSKYVCVYTSLPISEPEVNRQVKSQRRGSCVYKHTYGLSCYGEKLFYQEEEECLI